MTRVTATAINADRDIARGKAVRTSYVLTLAIYLVKNM